jgi:hypothetical protein
MKNQIAKYFKESFDGFKGIADPVERTALALAETCGKFEMAEYKVRACIRFPHLTVQELSKNWK